MGPLQLMGPGDHPMQKLALMMAVMMLGMSPAQGCSTSIDLGNQGAGGQAEMILPPSTWSSDDGEALMTEGRVSSTAVRKGRLWNQEGSQSGKSCNKSSWGSKA
jgi:hypothetical protein